MNKNNIFPNADRDPWWSPIYAINYNVIHYSTYTLSIQKEIKNWCLLKVKYLELL